MGPRGQLRIRTPNKKEEQLGCGGFVCAFFGLSAPRTQCLLPREFVHKDSVCHLDLCVGRDRLGSMEPKAAVGLSRVQGGQGRLRSGFLGASIRKTWAFLLSFFAMRARPMVGVVNDNMYWYLPKYRGKR